MSDTTEQHLPARIEQVVGDLQRPITELSDLRLAGDLDVDERSDTSRATAKLTLTLRRARLRDTVAKRFR